MKWKAEGKADRNVCCSSHSSGHSRDHRYQAEHRSSLLSAASQAHCFQACPAMNSREKLRRMRAILAGMRKGRVGRGGARKIAVFALKRGGKVYTTIIPNAKTETLLLIIQEKVRSTVWCTATGSNRTMRWT